MKNIILILISTLMIGQIHAQSTKVPLNQIVDLAGLSVLGRSANTSGGMAAITGTDGQVLRVSGTSLGFGTISAAGLASGIGGIYGGSGNIATGAVATLLAGEAFEFAYSTSSTAISIDDDAGDLVLYSPISTVKVGLIDSGVSFSVLDNGIDVEEDAISFVADTGFVRIVLYEPSADGSNYTAFVQPAMTASQIYTLPSDAPADGDVLTWNTTGLLSWEPAGGSDGNGIYDGDGTLPTGTTNALLPTNAEFRLDYDGGNPGISINDAVDQAYISGQSGTYTVYADNSNSGMTHGTGGWLTGSTYALTGSASVASTNTVTDRLVIQGNVASTVASAGFGSGILFQGESSTTDNQDMARISARWETATHSGRKGQIVLQAANTTLENVAVFTPGGSNGYMTIGTSGSTQYYDSAITPGTNFTLGSTGSKITMSSSSNAADAILISSTASTSSSIGSIRIGASSLFSQTSGTRSVINTSTGFSPTSGTAVHNSYEFSGTFNQTGGANGITRGIYLNQTLTAVADFRALEIAANGTNGKAIYQTGATMTNNFVGGIAAGTTSAPNASAQIDIVSTTKGLGIPSMTDAQRDAISSPREGLVVYTTDQDALSLRDNGIWKRLPTTRTVLKTADETVNNSSTYQTDDALTFTAKANKKYVVKYYISLNDPNNDVATGGTKFKVTASGATTVKYYAELSNLVFGATYSNNPHSDNAADIYCADAFASYTDDFMYVQMTAYINPGASDRTVNLEWAQINANANNTKILEGSFLEYEEIN